MGTASRLNVANTFDQKKFAKIGRFLTPQKGNQFVAESYFARSQSTSRSCTSKRRPEAMTGQLRLVRKGKLLSYHAADGLNHPLQEVARGEFTEEDLPLVRFIANNNESLNALDVRLVSLKIRSTKPAPELATEPAVNPVDPPVQSRQV